MIVKSVPEFRKRAEAIAQCECSKFNPSTIPSPKETKNRSLSSPPKCQPVSGSTIDTLTIHATTPHKTMSSKLPLRKTVVACFCTATCKAFRFHFIKHSEVQQTSNCTNEGSADRCPHQHSSEHRSQAEGSILASEASRSACLSRMSPK